MELASQIKRRRSELGLSQEELAAKIYVTRQTVSNWETNRTYPNVESLLLLSVLFDVTVDELIKGDVEAMKDLIADDAKKIRLYTAAGITCGVLAMLAVVGGISFWGWGVVPSAIIGTMLVAGYFVAATMLGSIQKKHDLVTYREIVAFSKGEPIDRDNPKSQRARQHRAAKTVAIGLVAAIIGGFVGYFAYRLIG